MEATEVPLLLDRAVELDIAVVEEAEEKGGDVLATLSEGEIFEDKLGAGAAVTELVVTEPGDEEGEPVVKHSLVELSSDIFLKSVNILLPSLARSSFSSMREFDEEQLAEVVVTTDVPRLEDEHTDIGCVKLFRTNSDIEDVVVESVDTTTVSGVEEIETALVGCLELFGTMAEIVEAEDDTDIGCVNLFTTNSEAVDIIDVVVDSVETTNVSRVEGLVTALVGCVVLPGTTVEFVVLDDTDISCVPFVDTEVEVEDIEDDSSVDVEEPQLVLNSLVQSVLDKLKQ